MNNYIWIVLCFVVACGGQVDPVSSAPAEVDPYPCPVSDHLICDECQGQPAGAVCGIWGVCGAVAPFCEQPCDHLANNSACAPGRHCQQLEEGKPMAACVPGEGVK